MIGFSCEARRDSVIQASNVLINHCLVIKRYQGVNEKFTYLRSVVKADFCLQAEKKYIHDGFLRSFGVLARFCLLVSA